MFYHFISNDSSYTSSTGIGYQYYGFYGCSMRRSCSRSRSHCRRGSNLYVVLKHSTFRNDQYVDQYNFSRFISGLDYSYSRSSSKQWKLYDHSVIYLIHQPIRCGNDQWYSIDLSWSDTSTADQCNSRYLFLNGSCFRNDYVSLGEFDR